MTDVEKILQDTDGGYDIFARYLGEVSTTRKFSNPYRDDSIPSCRLYYHNYPSGGRYYLQDFGDSTWCGDCFHFIARLHNLDERLAFSDVLEVISRDIDIPIVSRPSRKDICHISQDSFTATYHPFYKRELEFWQQYGISKDVLERFNVKAVEECTINKNGSSFTIKSIDNPVFGYLVVDGIKLYRPFATEYRFLYGGVLPKPYIFGWDQLPDFGDVVYITGGEKDVLSLVAHGFNAICFNSETAHISPSLMQELSQRFNETAIVYDMDETGRRESANRVKEHADCKNVFRIDLPLSGAKSEKDISDYFRFGYTSEDFVMLTRFNKAQQL